MQHLIDQIKEGGLAELTFNKEGFMYTVEFTYNYNTEEYEPRISLPSKHHKMLHFERSYIDVVNRFNKGLSSFLKEVNNIIKHLNK